MIPTPPRGFPAIWLAVPVVIAAGLIVTFAEPLEIGRISRTAVLSLAVLGVTMVTGQTGLVSLGHGAFVGCGAFSMAIMLDDVGLPFPLAIAATAVVVGLIGAVLGLPALRLGGLQLALVTFGFAFAFPVIARQMPRLTGGVSGRPIAYRLDPPGWMPAPLDEPAAYRFVVALLVCFAGFWLASNIVGSRMGRAMRAVRDNSTAAAVSGVDLTAVKVTSFAFSAALAGVGGALQATLFPFVAHDQFDVFLSLRLYAAAVLGGLSSVAGAVIGDVLLIVIPRANDLIGVVETENLAFGLGLILLTFIAPGGVMSLLDKLWSRVEGRGDASDDVDDEPDDDAGRRELRPTAAARRRRPAG